jgi:hypothetical protein
VTLGTYARLFDRARASNASIRVGESLLHGLDTEPLPLDLAAQLVRLVCRLLAALDVRLSERPAVALVGRAHFLLQLV